MLAYACVCHNHHPSLSTLIEKNNKMIFINKNIPCSKLWIAVYATQALVKDSPCPVVEAQPT